MRWNWTQPDWPNLRFDSDAVESFERRFLLSSGEFLGAVRHVTGDERDRLRIELLSEEAMRTSAIEAPGTGRRRDDGGRLFHLRRIPDPRHPQPLGRDAPSP